eukprot:scaffold42409_cov214-Amphora_coffeaeformis.AAC.4
MKRVIVARLEKNSKEADKSSETLWDYDLRVQSSNVKLVDTAFFVHVIRLKLCLARECIG